MRRRFRVVASRFVQLAQPAVRAKLHYTSALIAREELGYDLEYSVNRGIMVPKGTPANIIAKLDDACAKATKEPEFAKAMLLQGTEVRYMNAKAYGEFLKKSDMQTKDISKALGLLKRE